jgi:hypothetical protein
MTAETKQWVVTYTNSNWRGIMLAPSGLLRGEGSGRVC